MTELDPIDGGSLLLETGSHPVIQNRAFGLGEFLLELELVSPQCLQRGGKLSSRIKMPLGMSLILLESLDQSTLRAVVEALTLVKDNLITVEVARECLQIVIRNEWSLVDALVIHGIDAHCVKKTRLGELVGSAKAWSDDQMMTMLRAADIAGLPLGKVLVLADELSNPYLELALDVQKRIRLGGMDRDNAIEILQSQTKKEEAIQSTHKFGELLQNSGVLNDSAYREALEAAREENMMVCKFLIESGKLQPEIIAAALRLQEMVWNRHMSPTIAVKSLKIMHQRQCVFNLKKNGAIEHNQPNDLSLEEFLQLTGYLDPELIDLVKDRVGEEKLELQKCMRDDSSLARILKEVKPQHASSVEAAMILIELIKMDKMTIPQGLVNFAFSHYFRKQ